MDGKRFDQLARTITRAVSRRGLVFGAGVVLSGLVGQAPVSDAEAACRPARQCGSRCCRKGKFCCNPEQGICCSKKNASCCNPDAGQGTCCAEPRQCARPIDNETAPFECCPKERQWFTTTGLVRCCAEGTRSLGTGITSDDGPCCPEEKYCSKELTGGMCCPDLAPVCVDRSKGLCCTEADQCGTKCCGFGQPCCNGKCCPFGQICDGGTTCKCPSGVLQCGDTCCHASAVGCDGSRCLNQCDIDKNCGG